MPYKRRYKRRYKRKRRGKYSLQQQINWLKKKTNDQKPQLQFDDTSAVDADCYETAQVVKIDAGGPGDSRVLIKSIQMKGQLAQASAVAQKQYYRIIIFTDKSNEGGAIPAFTDVYSSGTGIAGVLSLRNLGTTENEGQRFKIIYDRTFSMVFDADAEVDNKKKFDFYKKLNIKSVNGTGGGFWEAGGLYLAYVGATATGVCDFTYNIRVRYIEKSGQ